MMSEKKQPVDLGLLEEDDEFEEFPAEDWAGLDEDEDAHVWEDNWDDDNVEDDFSNQLRTGKALLQDGNNIASNAAVLMLLMIHQLDINGFLFTNKSSVNPGYI
ncbi:26S proteasome complex subunit SEM1 isoform X1 [Pantherophis guttatus]|uniref:26S proteasome complex subunit SEM1 n=1 Tax=Pantherophis guttatus TaxID=94885 RepID=A0A6P9AHB7_PANGU|nr:26S proteasome complex subunit SEM1 isoform X1 [Pantherophis guttatus]